MFLSLGLKIHAAPAPDFNREIRPILSEKCFRCHGPDEHERKGGDHGLRLDTEEGAFADLGGYRAIDHGKPDDSELILRILLPEDDEELMPPKKTGKRLTTAEIALLREWIAAGAPYAKHWAYEAPRRTAPPAVKQEGWPRGAVDRFLLAKIEAAGLTPQPEADRATLARRAALDLTGLPPALDEVDALVNDTRPDAFERYVDRQLAKPSYGEHWARMWLDLARYADSKGYADDQPRSIWRYRDYVIDAYNQNKPFDQFTIEQIAGDLLPHPTEEQLFATGFHRNTMTNTEGGTDDEEFRSAAVVDRVNTTMAVWMGTSIACAQCHTHKYDPLTHAEYFQLYALFNQSEDADRSDEAPLLEFYTEEQKRERSEWSAQLAQLSTSFAAAMPNHRSEAKAWADQFPSRIEWAHSQLSEFKSLSGAEVELRPDGHVWVAPGKKEDTYTFELTVPAGVPVTAFQLESLPEASLPGKGAGSAEGNFVVTRVRAGIRSAEPVRQARFVRIELLGKDRTLQLAEVEVMSAGKNIAAQGTPRQSSTNASADAAKAIDGNTNGDIRAGSLIQTESGENPWWELDLSGVKPVERVVVWGRTGAEATPAGLRVSVMDEHRAVLWEQTAREAPSPSRSFEMGDPVDLKLGSVVADYAQADFDETFVLSDQQPKMPNVRKRTATKRGWGVEGRSDEPHTLSIQTDKPIVLAPGERLVLTLEQKSAIDGATLNHFKFSATTEPRVAEYLRVPPATISALQVAPESRTPTQDDSILDYYVRRIAPALAADRAKSDALQKSLDEMTIQSSPIMREVSIANHRKTHIQLRGNFMALGDEVQGGVPAVFPPFPKGAAVDRLTLARWLVDEKNPLTARVVANRYWETIFGLGLVRTSEEFGSQGEPPTHPELLDWLALELMAMKWDLKAFLRVLVTSAAYRQNSKVTPQALAEDPENRLLARGPRVRLGAEMVRDQALAVSGLLSPRSHGPSSRPFQPGFGLNAAFGSTLDWKMSTGDDRLRRGFYTEWRRSSPYPSMVTFDAPNREVCTLRRNRSNTPLQALVTLNDPVYVEAAQALARIIAVRMGTTEQKISDGFKRVVARMPTPVEMRPLVTLYDQALTAFEAAPEQASLLVANPDLPLPKAVSTPELAAWTTVTNVLLNLDEALMKR